MDELFGVLLHRDVARRRAARAWPVRNRAEAADAVDTGRLHEAPPHLYEHRGWRAEVLQRVSLEAPSGARFGGYLTRLWRRRP